MLSSSSLKYTDNNAVDVLCKYIREIILEPYGVGLILISHLNASGRDASGAGRWAEVAGWVGEIKNCVEEGAKKITNKENFVSGKILSMIESFLTTNIKMVNLVPPSPLN